MTDHLTKARRSWNMSRIQSKDTKPEKIIRSLLHRMGYRFCLYRKDLPGKPDIVLPKYKTVVFVHGCFWHRHKKCKRCTTPSTNKQYWLNKFIRNQAKDKLNIQQLKDIGWKTIILWECEVNNIEKMTSILNRIKYLREGN